MAIDVKPQSSIQFAAEDGGIQARAGRSRGSPRTGVGPPRTFRVHPKDGFRTRGIRTVILRQAPCLRTGDTYRVELRLGENIVARGSGPVLSVAPSSRGVVVDDQGIAICLPDYYRWRPLKKPVSDHTVMAFGEDKVAGVDVYAFFVLRDPTATTRDDFRHRAIVDTMLRKAAISRDTRPKADTCKAWPRRDEDSGRAEYNIGSYDLLEKQWSSRDGLYHVAVVWRNRESSSISSQRACDLLAAVASVE